MKIEPLVLLWASVGAMVGSFIIKKIGLKELMDVTVLGVPIPIAFLTTLVFLLGLVSYNLFQ